MNVTFEKKENVYGYLTITINEEDYKNDVKKELANIGLKHPLKGFRPGHVPAGLLQKMYGAEVKANIVDRKVSRELSKYIVDNKIDVLGEPMLAEETKVDFTKDTEFTFKFEMGVAPEFDIKLDKRVKIPYYNIEVSQKMVDEQTASFKKRFGKQVNVETVDDDALVRGSMKELNADGTVKEGGIEVEKTVVSPQYLKDADEQKKFIGKKVNDKVVYNPYKAANGSVAELAALLNVDKNQANVESDFEFTITEVLVNEDAEMNQEFFDNVLGKDVAKNEKEYTEKVKEMIGNQLKNDSNYRFTIDAERVLCKKVGKLELPDDILKKFLIARSKEENAAEKVEADYPKTREQIIWQLVKEKVARNLGVKVESEDLTRLAKFYAAQQFAQYGMTNLPDDVIEKYAKELLQKEDVSQDIQNRAFEDKVYAAIKGAVGIDEKTVTVEEFNKLFETEKK